MTQTLDVLDADRRFTADGSRAKGTPTAAEHASATKFGTFAITFGIAFALLYTIFERLNWPLFTYHPVSGRIDFWREPTGVGPPMFWYGWLTLSVISAGVIASIATIISSQWISGATVFCCVLAALWPTSLAALRLFIDAVSFNADFLDSIWIAAVPALIGAVAITYFAPSQWVQRAWTSWLLIVPIVGLVILGYSLESWFVRLR